MKASFEVVILPVADPDRSLRFYRDQVGFDFDVDYASTPEFWFVQPTPAGSGTSIQFGVGLTAAPPGSLQGLHLVVPDRWPVAAMVLICLCLIWYVGPDTPALKDAER
jgi:catechol 2,3-dioxygenase-like lactoylglutathione lyase family enzyme